MTGTKFSLAFAAAALGAFFFASNPGAAAQTETVLHSFSGSDGISPVLTVIFDSAGNLYGVTSEGGASNSGTVYELSPAASGSWTETTLYTFSGGADGAMPAGGLVFDSAGNLYGSTKLGGTNGSGVVYELTKSSSGSWSQKVLHTFGSGTDGKFPRGSLIFDQKGNLYGTTAGGGAHGNGQENTGGTAYKLSPKSSGAWTETILHSFGQHGDGVSPRDRLAMDSAGNLYGTTKVGGAFQGGTVFELTPKSGGGWTEQILHSFNPTFNQDGQSDGYLPAAGVTLDASGNIFGTTVIGGNNFGGTAYELSAGTWAETVVYNFDWLQYDRSPYSEVILDSQGNLYGADIGKGNVRDFHGVVFKLSPQTGTQWTLHELYVFDGPHGAEAGTGSLVFDSAGFLYGATQSGGSNQDGVVFKITP